MFRAEIFDEGRGYLATEETLRCEDYEIFMHLIQRGLKGYNLQETLFRYRETKESYRKRKTKYRINEAKTRYRNYKQMGKLFPIGWVFVLRPIVACLVPPVLLEFIKRSEGIKRKDDSRREVAPVQLNIASESESLRSFETFAGTVRQTS